MRQFYASARRASVAARDQSEGERRRRVARFRLVADWTLRIGSFLGSPLPHASRRLGLSVALAVIAAGCAQVRRARRRAPTARPAAKPVAHPRPSRRLRDQPVRISASLSAGYARRVRVGDGRGAQGCVRFAADGNYRTGWQDGIALCRRSDACAGAVARESGARQIPLVPMKPARSPTREACAASTRTCPDLGGCLGAEASSCFTAGWTSPRPFQFLVDAFCASGYVIAPDLRG
jgi:hypothetical protein